MHALQRLMFATAVVIGTAFAAAPDGHTLLYVLPNFVTSPALQPSLPFDPLKDFASVTQIGISTNILVAAPTLGVKTVKDFIALAKAQPGKLIFGSGATGTAGHLSGARFGLIAGIKVIHVAFKGGPDAATMGVALPFIKGGKLQALAVMSPQRAPILADVPALTETQSEFTRPETSHGLVAPAGTPRVVLNLISKEIARILDLPDIRERLHGIGYVSAPTTPEAYDKILRDQIDSLTKLVRDAGLRPK